MIVLEFTLILLLQLEGLGAGGPSLYHRVGDDVFLPCSDISHTYFRRRSDWFYTRDPDTDSQMEVQRGMVVQSSPRAARLRVDRFSSLLIYNITAEDAGRYSCVPWDKHRDHLDSVFLNILTISPSESETTAGAVSLRCSLRSFSSSCPVDSLRWLDETGTELTDGADDYKVRRKTNCVSVLTTTRWSDWNRAFSCRFVEGDSVMIDAHYTPVSAGTGRGANVFLYHRAGDEAVLPCGVPPSSCSRSTLRWFYNRGLETEVKVEVKNGEVLQGSGRAGRLSVSRFCSLIITNIRAEDAGRYICWLEGNFQQDFVYLSVLTISSSDIGGNVSLQCSLRRHAGAGPCPVDGLRWADETGAQLLRENAWFSSGEQSNCVSNLTVEPQISRNRTFSCIVT
ncbi:uncharacterized protein LOC106533240 [Austrofundulus limnaeus]|uniref:Uncharacterized protein LOC106533240 n=1 Tax=Austrofundulus limnaeus TaxID=52670 RepID=A0A2I4CY61_AUSLI|nr:PREDICTED: uncharacterized protein LOC106533240 [Austrofundulus limnaeus]